MSRPTYENVTEMERAALGEEDRTCNMRLARPERPNDWLVVKDVSNGEAREFSYTRDIGRKPVILDRNDAQRLIDREWGRI